MTRIELIRLLVGQARSNGFEFRKWYTNRLARPWVDAQRAFEDLAAERRYYALLFSHEFASSFWKAGNLITFQVPPQSFSRRMADGTVGVVKRKAYTRRTAREDVWRYHLQQLAVAEEPLRYMRRYLRVEEDLEADAPSDPLPSRSKKSVGTSQSSGAAKSGNNGSANQKKTSNPSKELTGSREISPLAL